MSQPVTQARICYLEDVGLDTILTMVAEGMFLHEIAEHLDPNGRVGITKSLLSRWLSGKLLRNVSHRGRPPETRADGDARAARYKQARETWAESVVERQAARLFTEENDRMANLRKAQAEFAMRLAGIHSTAYRPPPASITAVQLNLSANRLHLDALRRRTLAPPRTPPALPVEDAEPDALAEPTEVATDTAFTTE